MIYAFKSADGWRISGLVARFNGIGGFHALTDEQRAAHGWYPCIEVNAAFNPATQIRSPAQFTLADGVVTATYQVWDKSAEQIADEAEKALHAATQTHIDAVAQARGYNDGVSLASYVDDPKPQWAAEAAAFVQWRSDVWQAFLDTESTDPDQFIATLPAMEWPE